MTATAAKRTSDPPVETEAVLAALPDPILVLDAADRLRYANAAAEQFFDTGATLITDKPVAGVPSITTAEGLKLCWG